MADMPQLPSPPARELIMPPPSFFFDNYRPSQSSPSSASSFSSNLSSPTSPAASDTEMGFTESTKERLLDTFLRHVLDCAHGAMVVFLWCIRLSVCVSFALSILGTVIAGLSSAYYYNLLKEVPGLRYLLSMLCACAIISGAVALGAFAYIATLSPPTTDSGQARLRRAEDEMNRLGTVVCTVASVFTPAIGVALFGMRLFPKELTPVNALVTSSLGLLVPTAALVTLAASGCAR